MPLIATAALAYIIGLLGGFHGLSIALALAIGALAWLAWQAGKPAALALTLILAAGLLAARSSRNFVARTRPRYG